MGPNLLILALKNILFGFGLATERRLIMVCKLPLLHHYANAALASGKLDGSLLAGKEQQLTGLFCTFQSIFVIWWDWKLHFSASNVFIVSIFMCFGLMWVHFSLSRRVWELQHKNWTILIFRKRYRPNMVISNSAWILWSSTKSSFWHLLTQQYNIAR